MKAVIEKVIELLRTHNPIEPEELEICISELEGLKAKIPTISKPD